MTLEKAIELLRAEAKENLDYIERSCSNSNIMYMLRMNSIEIINECRAAEEGNAKSIKRVLEIAHITL